MKRVSFLGLGVLIAASSAAFGGPSLNYGPPYISTGSFSRPFGVGVDSTHQRLLVADAGNNRFKWIPLGQVATATGTYTDVGYVSSRTDPASLNEPEAITADAAGNVYIVNTLTADVKLFRWSGGAYAVDLNFCKNTLHTVAGVAISYPRDVAVGPSGDVYLLDSGNKRILHAIGPNDVAWTVFKNDPSWNDPYGLTVDANGVVFVADTGNHRILKITTSSTTVMGRYGTDAGEFRYPRGVSVDRYGRIYVADTFNHRLQVLASDGHPLLALGHAPGMGTLDKVVVDSFTHVFAVDSDQNHVLAYLGGNTRPAFDVYLRDYAGDPGDEPSNTFFNLSSPDILVRNAPDVNLATAAAQGLASYAFQQPRYNMTNYVYVALHNRGSQPASDNFVKFYYYDPSSPQHYPADWKSDGFFSAYTDAAHNQPGSAISVPTVAAGGVVVVGPLLWRPPAPNSAIAADGKFRLAARAINPYDQPPVGTSTTMPRDSNNVAERPVTVLPAPFTTGVQNTLVVRVHFPDLTSATDEATVNARMAETAAWVTEVSWGEASVTVLNRGPVAPPNNSSYYYDPTHNPLIDLTQDVLQGLLSAEPNLLDGSATQAPIGRIVLVTNDLDSTKDWATTGTWPYTTNGMTRYLSVSIQGGNNPTPQFSHGMSHQFNMLDLYAYDNVFFSRPYADGWDNMAKPFSGEHPLVWSKELSYWVSAHNSQIMFVPRPPGGTTVSSGYYSSGIPLHYQETASSGEIVGIAFGLTNGITNFSDETSFYFMEARKNSGAGAGSDSVLPGTGVLMYSANRLIPQGQGPVILRDHVPGGTLNDAAIPVGGSEAPAGTGLSVSVLAGANGADYGITYNYSPPITDYDVFIHPGPQVWESPDIWVDNQSNGYDEDNGRAPQDRGDLAIAGEENRLYARVFNAGPADAYDIEVAFLISEPYHTIGNEAAFTQYRSVFIDHLSSGTSQAVYVPWTPQTGIDPHTCVRIELRRLFNDTNATNNWAQRNLQVDHSEHGSPYTPFDFHFQVANATDTPRLMIYRVDGMPKGWAWSLNPPKAFVAPHVMSAGTLHIQPNLSTPDCSARTIHVTEWEPGGDTLVQQGGATVEVDLQKKTAFNKTRIYATSCTTKELASIKRSAIGAGPSCQRIVANGCTSPSLPNQPITVRYLSPDGVPVYHQVMTNASGCFQDDHVVTDGGSWVGQTQYVGNVCQGPAIFSSSVTVTLPVKTPPDDSPKPTRTYCLTALSKNVSGALTLNQSEGRVALSCPTTSSQQDMTLAVQSSTGSESASAVSTNGSLHLYNLRLVNDGSSALVHGLFKWEGKNFSAVGRISGIANAGTHRAPATFAGSENLVAQHEELYLTGTAISGALAGQRVRATLSLDWQATTAPTPISIVVRPPTQRVLGTLEGVLEKDCLMNGAQLGARVKNAQTGLKIMGPCQTMPCLNRVSLSGTGQAMLTQIEHDQCGLLVPTTKRSVGAAKMSVCTSSKTWDSMQLYLKNDSTSVLDQGYLTLTNFLQVSEDHGRGEHTGAFVFSDQYDDRLEGQLVGITQAGTHRKPSIHAFEKSEEPGHLEGRLVGAFTHGRFEGQSFEASFSMQITTASTRQRPVGMVLNGWIIKGCLEAPTTVYLNTPFTPVIPPLAKPPVLKPMPLPDDQFRSLGALPRAAVAAFVRAEGGRSTLAIQNRLRVADRQFRLLNASGSGTLSPSEFAAVSLSSSTQQLVVNQTFKKYDADNDGALTQAEAPKVLSSYAAFDTNHDGRLTRDEMLAALAGRAQREFAAVDKNHDGKIDFTEYVLWVRTLPRLSSKQ